MLDELLKRAENIRAYWRKLESVKGSGYHDNDGAVDKSWQVAPQNKGEPRRSTNAVLFRDRFGFVAFGIDATRLFESLQGYASKLKEQIVTDPFALTLRQQKQYQYIGQLGLEAFEGQPKLLLPRDEWDDLLGALYMEVVGVSILPMKDDGTDPVV